MHILAHIHTPTCSHVPTGTHLHMYSHSYAHIHTCSHIHTPTHVHAGHTPTYLDMHTDTHTCSDTYIHIHTRMHTLVSHKYTPVKHFVSLGNFSEDFRAAGRCHVTQRIVPTVLAVPSTHSLCLLAISSLHSSSTVPPQCQIFVPLFCRAILLPTLELGTGHACAHRSPPTQSRLNHISPSGFKYCYE